MRNTSYPYTLPIHKDWKYTALVPNVEVSTENARGVLPDAYSRSKVATAISNAILTSQALQEGNLPPTFSRNTRYCA